MKTTTTAIEYKNGVRYEHVTIECTIGDDMIAQSMWQKRAGELVKQRDKMIADGEKGSAVESINAEINRCISIISQYTSFIKGYNPGEKSDG